MRTPRAGVAWSYETGGKTPGEQRATWIRFVEESYLVREIASLSVPLRFDVAVEAFD